MKACSRFRQTSIGVLLFGAAFLRVASAHASVAVLLEEPYGAFSHLSPSGHVAVYLDHVCADTPLRVRPCHPGESGVVISRYDGIGDHEWIAAPLIGYLYAAQQPEEIPSSVTRQDVIRLREAYRRDFLMSVAPDLPDGSAPGGNWYELAGAAFNRTIYVFQVTSTTKQDDALIAFLNENPNRANYNGVLRNCADFVRTTVNRFYPHAIRRNYVADLGVTSPKSVARGLAHYAAKHPDIDFRTFRITQVPGTLPRSHGPVTLMEGISKELGIPLFFVSPVATGVAVTAWLTQGRFSEPKQSPELHLATGIALENASNRDRNQVGSPAIVGPIAAEAHQDASAPAQAARPE